MPTGRFALKKRLSQSSAVFNLSSRLHLVNPLNLPIHIVDLAVFIAYLCFVVAFGVWIGRGQKTLSHYLPGARNLPWWGLLGSIVATETSTVTFLSVPGITFAQGGDLRFLQLTIGYIVGRIIISVVMLPMYFRGQLFTAYEILENRFGVATKRIASILFLLARNFGDALRLFLTALVIEQMFGTSLELSVIVLGILTIVYTLFGGMKAVVWNDCIQFIVYILGGILIFAIIAQRMPNGMGQILEFGKSTDRLTLFDFSLVFSDAFTFWAGLIGGMFLTLGTHGVDQMLVQRYLSARSQADAAIAVVASGFVVCLQFAFFLMLGVALACYSSVNGATELANDRALANFIVNDLPAGRGLVGIILAGVFSAAMSTLSSSLNSSATVVVNDFLASGKKENDADSLLRYSRWLTAVFGVIQIVIAISAAQFSRSVVSEVLGIAGLTVGIILGLFALANGRLKISEPAAICGLVCGATVLGYVKFQTSIAWPWYALIGSATTYAFGSIIQIAGQILQKETA